MMEHFNAKAPLGGRVRWGVEVGTHVRVGEVLEHVAVDASTERRGRGVSDGAIGDGGEVGIRFVGADKF